MEKSNLSPDQGELLCPTCIQAGTSPEHTQHLQHLQCHYCHATNHLTQHHMCTICGRNHPEKAHLHCSRCNNFGHESYDHKCDRCLEFEYHSHSCKFCLDTHNTNDHKCEICDQSGHNKTMHHYAAFCSKCNKHCGHTETEHKICEHCQNDRWHQYCERCKTCLKAGMEHEKEPCPNCGHCLWYYGMWWNCDWCQATWDEIDPPRRAGEAIDEEVDYPEIDEDYISATTSSEDE